MPGHRVEQRPDHPAEREDGPRPTVTGRTGSRPLSISGPDGKTLSGGRSVNAGNTTWGGNTGNGNNAIAISGGAAGPSAP